ncbi:MAG: hypothetical protein H6907_03580 [Hyphomicrobiales bacterium]|nr:hypothetical protein [Hyphomicrobiales bacterium]MCP5370790.1 hypothetical protein [Hyphomicrobiales bacterium]
MAKQAVKTAAGSPPRGQARGGGRRKGLTTGHKLLLLIIVVVFGAIWPAVITLVGVGMLPTIVAFLVDRTRQKHAAFCVGGMNFCGVFPYVLDLWDMGAGMHDVMEILANVFTLFTICAAAAVGWVMYTVIPPVVTTVTGILNQRRIAALRRRQKQIVAEWGDGVAGPDVDLTAPDVAAAGED